MEHKHNQEDEFKVDNTAMRIAGRKHLRREKASTQARAWRKRLQLLLRWSREHKHERGAKFDIIVKIRKRIRESIYASTHWRGDHEHQYLLQNRNAVLFERIRENAKRKRLMERSKGYHKAVNTYTHTHMHAHTGRQTSPPQART